MGMIETKLKTVALEELNHEKEKRSKIKNINYAELKTQSYLNNKDISLKRKQLIFKMRTRMIETSENIGKQIPCKLCDIDLDDQTHIIQCIILKLRCPEILSINENMKNIIFGDNFQELNDFSIIYEKALRIRKILMKPEIIG